MGIFILIMIIIVVVGSGGLILPLMMLAAARKRAKNAPAVSAEPVRAFPDDPGLSDTEISKKLRVLQIVKLVSKIAIPIFFIGVLVAFVMNIGESMYLDEFFIKFLLPAGAAFILMFVIAFQTNKRVSELKSLMGASVTLPILREVFEVKSYQPHGHISRDIIGSAGLVYGWDHISGSDYFEGSYKGINILYSDLHLYHEYESTDSDGKKTTSIVTDFRGQWLVCDYGKELAATVRLIERKGGTTFQRKHDIGKSDIETENMEFNKKFRIITADGHTAFYLLTPHFMERLMAADAAADSSSLFCFQDGKVHVALYSGRDSLELGGVNPNNLEVVRQKFRKDLQYMTDIMDILLNSEEIFLKAASDCT